MKQGTGNEEEMLSPLGLEECGDNSGGQDVGAGITPCHKLWTSHRVVENLGQPRREAARRIDAMFSLSSCPVICIRSPHGPP